MIIFTIFLLAFTNMTNAANLPASNYECQSIATPVVDGQYGKEDVQKVIVGFVKTPDSPDYLYRNLGLVEFQHRLEDKTIYMAAQTGVSSYEYQSDVMFSDAAYYRLSSSLSDKDYTIVDSSNFEVPNGELPSRFGIRLNPITFDGGQIVLVRLECSFLESVDR